MLFRIRLADCLRNRTDIWFALFLSNHTKQTDPTATLGFGATLRWGALSLLAASAFNRSRIYGNMQRSNLQLSSAVDTLFSLRLGRTPISHDEPVSRYHPLANIDRQRKAIPGCLESTRSLHHQNTFRLSRSNLPFGTFGTIWKGKNMKWKRKPIRLISDG